MQNIFPAEAFQQQERYLCAVLLFPLSLSLVLFCFISPILKANFFSGKQSFCNQHWDDQLIVVLASCFPLENVLTWMFLKPHRNVFKGTENYLRKSWFSLWSAVVSSFHTVCRHSSQALWLLPGHQETDSSCSLSASPEVSDLRQVCRANYLGFSPEKCIFFVCGLDTRLPVCSAGAFNKQWKVSN